MRRLEAVHAGTALWYETNDVVGLHLTVVLTDPIGSPAEVAIVHATDAENDFDWTTVIEPGEHPRVHLKSTIVYAAAKIVKVQFLQGEVEYGRAKQVEDFSPELLERVRDGLLRAGAADEAVDDFCLDHFPARSQE